PSSVPPFAGDVWTSTDFGVTWANRTAGTSASGLGWSSVASDATGQHLVAVQHGSNGIDIWPGIWTSSDFGVTWTDRTASTMDGPLPLSLERVASDATGQYLVVSAYQNDL